MVGAPRWEIGNAPRSPENCISMVFLFPFFEKKTEMVVIALQEQT